MRSAHSIPTPAWIVASADAFFGAFGLASVFGDRHRSGSLPIAVESFMLAVTLAFALLLLAVPTSFVFCRSVRAIASTLQRWASILLLAHAGALILISIVIVNESLGGTLTFMAGIFSVGLSALSFWASRVLSWP